MVQIEYNKKGNPVLSIGNKAVLDKIALKLHFVVAMFSFGIGSE